MFIFSAYFVFQCLNMFCFEKQVSEFLATHFGYLRELPVLATQFGDLRELPVLATQFGDLQAASLSCEFIQRGFAALSRLGSRLASREAPRISFLMSFFVGNLF